MGRPGRRAALLLAVLAGALALPQAATAHALLQSSDPAAGANLPTAPSVVTLTFGEQPDHRLSSVKVLDSGGQDQSAGAAEAVTGQPDQLQVKLKPLRDGVYTVSWQTLSAVDGHRAAGSFAFGVGVAPPSPGTSAGSPAAESPSGSPSASLGRWLLYVGLMLVFGSGFVGLLAGGQGAPAIARIAITGWLLGAAGTLIVVGVQWSDAGADVSTLLSSSLGPAAAERIGSVMLTGALTGVLFLRRRKSGAPLLVAVAAAAAATMLVDVLNGHAAAGSLAPLQVLVQWLHVVAVGFWIGGLASMLMLVRGLAPDARGRLVRRFSTAAGVALAVVATSGVLRAINEIGSLDALVGTDFGRIVIAKTALLLVLAVLGAVNRFINVPRAATVLAGLRRVGTAEVGVALVVLLLTGILVNVAPPTSAGTPSVSSAPAPPLTMTSSDFGTSVRLRLVVAPGAAGFNQFTAIVTDFDTGAPAAADGVTLRFSLASKSGVGGSTLALASSGPGTFAASGANVSVDGIWRIVAVVTGQGGAVEVPFALSTVVPAEAVDVIQSPGAPTLYTVHLGGGPTVQLYFDPGRAGKNDLHATFFDAAGTELPSQTATMAVAAQGGPATVLNPRQLEPGHFVSSTTVPSGTVAVDVLSAAPGGGQLHGHLQMNVQP